jgi:hypothetical protein
MWPVKNHVLTTPLANSIDYRDYAKIRKSRQNLGADGQRLMIGDPAEPRQ